MKLKLVNPPNGCGIFLLIAIIFLLIGWIKCIVKAIECNYEPIGKAEVIYVTGSVVPFIGGIAGWINIEDK